MRAVVVIDGQAGDGPVLADRYPAATLWLVDRPQVQHVCEALVGQGVRVIDWVHHRAGDAARQLLGSGQRWGAEFHHHVSDDLPNPYPLVGVLLAARGPEQTVVLGHADRVPGPLPTPTTGTVVLGEAVGPDRSWSGWATFSAAASRLFPGTGTDRDGVGRLLADGCAGPAERAAMPVTPAVGCLESYLAAVRQVLADRPDAVSVPRSARVHPTARLVGPVYLGADVEIAAGATVGPNVAVGPNCVIDRGAVLADAVVLPNTFVGAGLRLENAVADRDRVVRPGPGGLVRVDIRAAVGDLAGHPLAGLRPAVVRRAKTAVRTVRTLGGVPARMTRKWVRAAAPVEATADPMPAAAY